MEWRLTSCLFPVDLWNDEWLLELGHLSNPQICLFPWVLVHTKTSVYEPGNWSQFILDTCTYPSIFCLYIFPFIYCFLCFIWLLYSFFLTLPFLLFDSFVSELNSRFLSLCVHWNNWFSYCSSSVSVCRNNQASWIHLANQDCSPSTCIYNVVKIEATISKKVMNTVLSAMNTMQYYQL